MVPSSKISAQGAGLLAGVAFLPGRFRGPGGTLGSPLRPASNALKASRPTELGISPPWPERARQFPDPGEARLEGASKSSFVHFVSILGKQSRPKVVFFVGVFFFFPLPRGGGEGACFSRGNSWGLGF